MLSRGELCRGCGKSCFDISSPTDRIEIENPSDPDSAWIIDQCPRRYVQEIVDEINLAQLADSHLPISGGVLDQSSWWVECWMAFRSDCSQIDQDIAGRERSRHG
ncbi:MAG: hypothetical protein DWH72_01345 [Planctomycetota bacterium]|nr:MAG: hypothetical protein DWH72_01345 [Planctomycetota bacterium]